MSTCSICAHDEVDRLEELGRQAIAGEISWRKAAEASGLTHHKGLQNHMQRHWVSPIAVLKVEADDVLAELIQTNLVELQSQMAMAPAEVKPLYAVAIRNLVGLKETKPNQTHLINALKTIHEITGMRMEQQMLLRFAQAKFGLAPATQPSELAESTAPLALEAMRGVLEAEVVESQ